MKKIRRTMLSALLAAAMAVSSLPVTAYAQQEQDTFRYVDENNETHDLVITYTDDMEISELAEKIGEISPVLGLTAEYEGIFEGTLIDQIPFSYKNTFVSLEDNALYMTDMLIYNAKDENGTKVFAVKFPHSTELYLYRITNDSEYRKGIHTDENKEEHEVIYIPTAELDLTADEIIEMNAPFLYLGCEFECKGKYTGEITENDRSFNFVNYVYVAENEIMYSTQMRIYCIRDENDEKAYAIKFFQFPDLYLYTLKDDHDNEMHWIDPLYTPETAGIPINYWSISSVNKVSLDQADISEINEKIGNIILFPYDEYEFAGKFENEVDFGQKTGGYEFQNYKYDKETNTLYEVAFKARMIQLENGEEAFLVKQRRKTDDNSWYLYKLSKKVEIDNKIAADSKESTENTLLHMRYNMLVPDGNGNYVTKNDGPMPTPVDNNNDDTPISTTAVTQATALTQSATVATTSVTTVPVANPVTVKINDLNKGDANCDNELSMADAVLIMQSLANPAKFGVDGTDEHHITLQGKVNADIVGENDGVTNADALAIQKMLLKLD